MTIEELKARRAQLLQNREHYAQLTLKTEGAIDMVDILIEEAEKGTEKPSTADAVSGLPDNIEPLPADEDS